MSAELTTASTSQGTDTALVDQICAAILRFVHDEGLAQGTRLTERALAERFKVSRSPVRRALQRLLDEGYVDRTETGRYQVATTPDLPTITAVEAGDDAYDRIVEDHLEGHLPDRVSESALARRYGLSRGQVNRLTRRISNEGWAVSLPGHGWEFLPVLKSMRSYQDSYRFRLMVEPRAILEPTFELNRAELIRRREEQQALVDGRVYDVSPSEIFELNTRLHGTIAECSGNSFIVESLDRINKLRRLIEYRQALNPDRAIVRCNEHVTLVGLLLADRRLDASDFLREHLTTVAAEKTT
ncbi:GntR family transcriptional regulator [Microbacterium enclense]|nr:GntR family transcriptional regulator [Microbacterium enclense]